MFLSSNGSFATLRKCVDSTSGTETNRVLKEGEGELDVGAQRLGFDFDLIT